MEYLLVTEFNLRASSTPAIGMAPVLVSKLSSFTLTARLHPAVRKKTTKGAQKEACLPSEASWRFASKAKQSQLHNVITLFERRGSV